MEIATTSRKSLADQLRVKTLRRLTSNFSNSDINNSIVDDESERSFHRKARAESLNKSTSLNDSFKFNGEEEIQDHFQYCTKLHAENRINNKVAWKLQIIDVLREISRRKGPDALVMAGTSLDIGAKVYGVKVDDVYNEGMKLASSLARMDNKQDRSINEDDNGNSSLAMDGIGRKDKKKRRRNMNKRTLVKDPKTLLAPLPKLESVAFSARVDSTESVVENLLTNKLCTDKSYSKFILFSEDKEKAMPQGPEEALEKLQTVRDFDMSQLPAQIVPICRAFRDFVLDEWDPDLEEAERKQHDKSIDNIVVHDEQGIPVHQLDGTLNDNLEVFTDNDDNVEDDQPREEIFDIHLARQNIEKITSITLPDQMSYFSSKQSEYSYNSVMVLDNGQIVDKMWAGPSHWKLKFLHSAKPKISIQSNQGVQKRAKSRKKTEVVPYTAEDFENKAEKMKETLQGKIKRKNTIVEDTVTCPHYDSSIKDLITMINNQASAMGCYESFIQQKLIRRSETDQINAEGHQNESNGVFDYDNGMVDGNDVDVDHSPEIFSPNDSGLAQQNFLDDNLVDAPQYVPQSQLTYATQAKRMDMKKLKTFSWNIITTHWQTRIDDPLKFSNIFKKLKNTLPDVMRNELSVGLALYSLLQLANENSLFLKNTNGRKDFYVSQAK